MKTLEAGAVAAAAARLAGVVNRTPVVTSRTLNEMTGHSVHLKCENFQRVGAFKFRGAYNAIASLDAASRRAGVITHSSGNHAQGVALAARLLGIRAVVVMPEDAPEVKRQATSSYGAEVVPCQAIEREIVTDELVRRHGFTLIHPYDDDHIIAGQGTAAWELFEEVGELDRLYVPVGGGGLISGCALAASVLSPRCQVIGVEPVSADDARRSWLSGDIVKLDHVPVTVADGLRPRQIGQRNLAIMSRHVADMITVTESQIIDALMFIWQRLKIVVEPSAATALAPVLAGHCKDVGRRVGVLLSGGNVDVLSFARQLESFQPHVVPEISHAADRDRPRILVTVPMSEETLAALGDVARVDLNTELEEESLRSTIADYHGLIVGENTPVSGQVIEYGYQLRVISSLSDRLDNIDVSAARSLGVDVHYDPGSRVVNEAESTMSLILDLAKRYELAHDDAAAPRLTGKTLGLVGFGRTALQVAKRAAAFDMRLLVNQPRLTPELALAAGVTTTDLDSLLSQADFVSLHLPMNTETRQLIGRQHLERMKPDAHLICRSHPDSLDYRALLSLLKQGHLAAAAVICPPPGLEAELAGELKELEAGRRLVLLADSAPLSEDQEHGASIELVAKTLASLRTRSPSETLSLDVLPIGQLLAHEEVDDKRVGHLMSLLERDGKLVNPPVVMPWGGRFVVLDGATRFNALTRLGYQYVIAQVVPASSPNFTLHTWYHVVSGSLQFSSLNERLARLAGLRLTELVPAQLPSAFVGRPAAICYLIDRQGRLILAEATGAVDRLAVMREIVSCYTTLGSVERTLLADHRRLVAQFPDMITAVIYPQLKPEDVFAAAGRGDQLPAGLTRFVISGRILRLKASLKRLGKDEPLAAKRAWLNQLLAERLASSGLRYYQEPVVLLDE